jgi:hypothetical protein
VKLGDETADALAVALEQRAIPTVFVTACSDGNLRQGFEAWPVVEKPYTEEQLLKLIGRILRSNMISERASLRLGELEPGRGGINAAGNIQLSSPRRCSACGTWHEGLIRAKREAAAVLIRTGCGRFPAMRTVPQRLSSGAYSAELVRPGSVRNVLSFQYAASGPIFRDGRRQVRPMSN